MFFAVINRSEYVGSLLPFKRKRELSDFIIFPLMKSLRENFGEMDVLLISFPNTFSNKEVLKMNGYVKAK